MIRTMFCTRYRTRVLPDAMRRPPGRIFRQASEPGVRAGVRGVWARGVRHLPDHRGDVPTLRLPGDVHPSQRDRL